MGKINLRFTSKNIDRKHHILSVLIEADSFVYGIFDREHNLIAANVHEMDLHSLDPLSSIKDDKQLGLNYYKVVVTYASMEFVHLNELDFAAGDFDVYFNRLSKGEELVTDKFTDSDVHVVFPVNNNLRTELKSLINPTTEVHISTALRQFIYPSQVKRNLILVSKDRLHYMSYEGGDLTLYNAYTYRTKEDFLYFLQLATNTSSVVRGTEVLEIGGWLDKTSDVYKLISPYYRNLNNVDMSAMKLSSTDDHHSKHHYFGLYASALCVS